MSNFRILILVFLVVVLAVLGMIYVNISSRMDVIQQQQIAPVPAPAAVNPSPYLPSAHADARHRRSAGSRGGPGGERGAGPCHGRAGTDEEGE